MKNLKYLSIKKFFFISLIFLIQGLNAAIDSTKDNSCLLERTLLNEYHNLKCALIDKDDDLKIQKKCFNIAKRLFNVSRNKKYLFFMADCYSEGIGVKKDINKGLKLYEQVASSDCELANEAQGMLGTYYMSTNSSIRDLEKAKHWFEKASINNVPDAQCNYASLLKSQGKDQESLYWYKKAAENNSLIAKYRLAELVRKGCKIGITRKEAYNLLHSAAEKNFALAFQELAIMYWQDGNNKKAKHWYCKFINTDFFKNVQEGMDPNKALTKDMLDDIKKQYGIEGSNLDQKTK
jgi:TPR repeat protein